MRSLSYINYLLAITVLCWLPACAPTGMSPANVQESPPAVNAVDEQQMQSIEEQLQRLQDSIVMLEARLLDQQRMIEALRQQPVPAGTGPGEADSDPATAGQQTPTEIYLAAFGDYAAGQYQKSITGFSRFLQFFPANDYASNARYWLAECYLALGQYEQAVTEFDRVAVDYPKSTKAPDALLKKAAALYQSNEEERAIATIELLKERYPESPAAKKAAESFN